MAFGTLVVLPPIQKDRGEANQHHSSGGRSPMWTSLPPLPPVPPRALTARNCGDDSLQLVDLQARDSAVSNDVKTHVQKHFPSFNIRGRRIPKPRTQEVFPRYDENRVGPDGNHVLSQPTRTAIDLYISKLYRSSRYEDQYKDPTDVIVRKLQRDAQRRAEAQCYEKASTCTRILNHPDPCYVCRRAPYDHHRTNLYDDGTAYSDYERSWMKPSEPEAHIFDSNFKLGIASADEGNSAQRLPYLYKQKMSTNGGQMKCGGFVPNPSANPLKSCLAKCDFKKKKSEMTSSQPALMTHFGPWDETKVGFSTEEEVKHLQGNGQNCRLYYDCECEHNDYHTCQESSMQPLDVVRDEADTNVSMPSASAGRPNHWTLRNENNLRMPCIFHVIGTLNKTAAHQRYHHQFKESVPDLRDFKKYSKRVQFFGYNSDVFR